MQRGEIWWATLPVPKGSEPGFRRPLVIVQSDEFNRSRIQTVVAAVITSNLRLAEAPGNVALSARDFGLPRSSVVNVSQLITIDKSFLTKKIRTLASDKIQEIETGLRLVLAL